jgi:hypothetical protein
MSEITDLEFLSRLNQEHLDKMKKQVIERIRKEECDDGCYFTQGDL